MFNSGSPGGISKNAVINEINSRISDRAYGDAEAGRDGWVSLGTVNLAGRNFIDLFDVPAFANEIDIAIQGISTTGTSSFYARVYNVSGVLISTSYFGYLNNFAGSGLSSVAESPGDAAILAGSLLAAGYLSGSVKLRRQLGSTWRIESDLFDAANRSIRSTHVTDNVGSGITGLRLLLGTAGVNFDAGSITVRWRR